MVAACKTLHVTKERGGMHPKCRGWQGLNRKNKHYQDILWQQQGMRWLEEGEGKGQEVAVEVGCPVGTCQWQADASIPGC